MSKQYLNKLVENKTKRPSLKMTTLAKLRAEELAHFPRMNKVHQTLSAESNNTTPKEPKLKNLEFGKLTEIRAADEKLHSTER